MVQITSQEFTCWRRVGDDALSPALRRLSTNTDGSVRWIDVLGAQQTQLFAAEAGVISECEHEAVADGFVSSSQKELLPLIIAGDPGEPSQPWDQTVGPDGADRLPWRVAAAPDWIACASSLMDEMVIEEPHCNEPLLNSGVRQPRARVDGHDVAAARMWSGTQVAHVTCDVRSGGGHQVHICSRANRHVIRQATPVGVDGPRRQPAIHLHLKPRHGLGLSSQL